MNLVDLQTSETIHLAVSSWQADARIADIEIITPDASSRRYYRVFFQDLVDKKIQSCVAMIFDSNVVPEAVGKDTMLADEAYVVLSKFFLNEGIAVPELYYDGRDSQILLIEDLGKRSLGEMLVETRASTLLKKKLKSRYLEAINQINKIQNIGHKEGVFVFNRHFKASVYQKEMSEFSDYLLPRYTSDNKLQDLSTSLYQIIGSKLENLPSVLSHRDFHSWNLMIDRDEKVRVIDFQDALMANGYYDIVSLLNDRDTDKLIGPEVYSQLLEKFLKITGHNNLLLYTIVLLQRDLKVAGRFAKLSSMGKPLYENWIPGTLCRIGRSLKKIEQANECEDEFSIFLGELERIIPEIAQSSSTPDQYY